MEREKAELEIEMPDGTIAKVISREEDHWVVETERGNRVKVEPPDNWTTERASATIQRELGS